jgi:hypothetical protein
MHHFLFFYIVSSLGIISFRVLVFGFSSVRVGLYRKGVTYKENKGLLYLAYYIATVLTMAGEKVRGYVFYYVMGAWK